MVKLSAKIMEIKENGEYEDEVIFQDNKIS